MTDSRQPGKKFRRISSNSSADDPSDSTAEFVSPYFSKVSGSGTVPTRPILNTAMATQQQFAEIMKKLEKLDVLDDIIKRLVDIENNQTIMKTKISDLEAADSFASVRIDALQKDKVEKSAFEKLEAKVEDLGNRARRNNLVFLNIPEGKEGQQNTGVQNDKCTKLIKKIGISSLQ